MLAATFAEAGEHETARQFVKRERQRRRVRKVKRQRPRLQMRAPRQ